MRTFPSDYAKFVGVAALSLVASSATAQNLDNGTSPFKEDASVSGSLGTGGGNANASSRRRSSKADDDEDFDPRVLQAQNTLTGTTGLVRTVSADSGAAGTFRMNVVGTYYKGSGFLCGSCSLPGPVPHGIPTGAGDDKVTQVGTRLLLSATPVDFLEGYAALRFQSTSDTKGEPRAIEIVGDTTLGVKLFTPPGPNSIFSFGGALDTLLVSSPGGVSFDAASVGIRALGTADFTRRTNRNDRIPLRLHMNLGYVFDGSGTLADDIEQSRNSTLKVEQRITRIERFGHDINRVDRFGTGIGVEGVFSWVRPFGEWTLDIPVNRQSHHCGNNISRAEGDGCLSSAGFAEVPSRVTLGARFYPWAAEWMQGLGLLLAADIGTGATGTFIEEVAPERPWAIHVGLGWAADTAPRGGPRKVVEKIVEVPAAPLPEHHIEGTVFQAGKEEPIANAIVRYENKSITGMVTSEDGKFRTSNLDPGEYRFTVTAEGFKDGDCTAVIPSDKASDKATGKPDAKKPDDTKPGAPPAPAPADKGAAPGTPPPASTPPASSPNVSVKCELEPLPRTATITGTLRNADSTVFIEGGTVTITDPLGRQLALKTDAEGTFRFGNVPAGNSKLSAEADGYLATATELTLEPRHDVTVQLQLHERPKTPNVVLTKGEIKLKKEVHFLHGSAEILPDSTAILEEVADVLRQHSEIANVEVQGHTDDSGTPELNLRLSSDRANAVRKLLVDNGVDGGRLTAHGYGQEKPLAPNTTPKNKAKNRRVQLVILP